MKANNYIKQIVYLFVIVLIGGICNPSVKASSIQAPHINYWDSIRVFVPPSEGKAFSFGFSEHMNSNEVVAIYMELSDMMDILISNLTEKTTVDRTEIIVIDKEGKLIPPTKNRRDYFDLDKITIEDWMPRTYLAQQIPPGEYLVIIRNQGIEKRTGQVETCIMGTPSEYYYNLGVPIPKGSSFYDPVDLGSKSTDFDQQTEPLTYSKCINIYSEKGKDIIYQFDIQQKMEIRLIAATFKICILDEDLNEILVAYDRMQEYLDAGQYYLVMNSGAAYGELSFQIAGRVNGFESKFEEPEGITTYYNYNIRSWTARITNHTLAQLLDYDYNGNIHQYEWTRAGGEQNKYNYLYDALSRITKAVSPFQTIGEEVTGSAYSPAYSRAYGVSKVINSSDEKDYSTSYQYDKHGNIRNITRNGLLENGKYGAIDILALTYNGNQLDKVSDRAGNTPYPGMTDYIDRRTPEKPELQAYHYNRNGAMTYDPSKGMQVNYNYLNLPNSVAVDNPDHQGEIKYTYSATGKKVRVEHLCEEEGEKKNKITHYIGNKI